MQHLSRGVIGFALLSLFIASGCEDNSGLTMADIESADGYVPSAGTSSLYINSSIAFDSPAEWVEASDVLTRRFNLGDKLYDNGYTMAQGLGPVYAGFSCGFCHQNAGRSIPSFAVDSGGGSPAVGYSTMLIYITRKNGTFFPDYGRVIHDHGYNEQYADAENLTFGGIHAEGKLRVKWEFEDFTFPDGTPYQLRRPQYSIVEWYADSIKPEDLFITVRVPLRHVGMGQMMALDPAEIEALARKSNYPEFGINGRCNYINERGQKLLGVSGNKAQHADLTVELGFSSDMGVTNSRFPEEICEGQRQMDEGSLMGLLYDQLDVSTKDMEDVDLYLHGLGVPARRLGSATTDITLSNHDNSKSATRSERDWVALGEKAFYKANCQLCHVTTLHTKPRGTKLLNGTELPWIGSQTIHPYSDYLLHDMGSEIMGVGLNDNYVSGLARGCDWRTTPLWGVGLQEKVNRHTYFLHDGRARGFVEAIMWHGGEGEASKNIFMNMDWEERSALVKFLESL
ncbi:MAG: thiol oxidoreductase [Bacteroidaceae bacterium]|nr:thiol oxidoreductase [Bacteroidaceae bacterium]